MSEHDRRGFMGALAVAGLRVETEKAADVPAEDVTRILAHWVVNAKPADLSLRPFAKKPRASLGWSIS